METQRICLVHYHEIGLKGHNRANFEQRMIGNLKSIFKDDPIRSIKRISGRLAIYLDPDVSYETACEISDRVAGIPGCARVSCGYVCEQDLDVMYEIAVQALRDVGDFQTFKVAARRNHTDFPTDSMQLNQLVGAHLCQTFPEKTVKMKQPDAQVNVEVIEGFCCIYARSIQGVGGLPVGTAGRVACLLSSGIDSPVAAWRIARRGAVCVGVHFSGRPETSPTSEYLVDDIAHVLERTGCIARVYVVPLGEFQREIAGIVPPPLRIIMYRRLMYKVAEQIAIKERCGAIATGESLGQVASQTIDNIAATDDAVTLPVFRPLIGSDKVEIIRDAQQLGTFDISSQDAPDCCTLYMPKSPETHARLKDVHEAEALYPVDEWVPKIVESAEIHDYRCSAYKSKKSI